MSKFREARTATSLNGCLSSHYRLYDRFSRPIASFGVLCDDSDSWRPQHYLSESWGCETLLRFPTVKLIDYDARWEDLDSSWNPFAVMVMAHLKTCATRKDPEARLQWKLRLTKGLYEKGYGRENVLELFRFIDWLQVLPEGLGRRFQERLTEYEARTSRLYVTSIERSDIERGLMAERALLLRLTSRRFGDACAGQLERLLAAADDPEQLVEVGEWIIDCETLLARVQEWAGGQGSNRR
jgi:hypothetical protein